MRTDQETVREERRSLSVAAARTITSTTKSVPQAQARSPRWLMRMLPWVEAQGGAYRVNRRLTYTLGDGRVTFTNTGADVRVVPQELRELPPLRDFADESVLSALAERFEQLELGPDETVVAAGQPADRVYLIVRGRVRQLGVGEYGDETLLGVYTDGDFFGDGVFEGTLQEWGFTVRTTTPTTLLALRRQEIERLRAQSPLGAHITRNQERAGRKQNKHGEAAIDIASGHDGEPPLPGTYVDYEVAPREYELSVAQTILKIHTRVADLYNKPMHQFEQQLRLTVEALRERQEHELLNNRDFGLLHNADLRQRISTRSGPPTPDDLDELLSRRRKSRLLLAHPKAIAAFGRECNRRGLYPPPVALKEADGRLVHSWRGVPLLPCDKIPISEHGTSSIIVMRTGAEDQGVVGLRQTGIPDEVEPGLNVRFMGIDTHAVSSYLVSTYFSAAVLVPDALGVLEHVEIGG